MVFCSKNAGQNIQHKLVSGFARISVPKSKHSCEIPSFPLLFFFAIDFMIFVTFLSLTSFTENDRFLLARLSFSFSKGFLIRFRCSKKKLQPKLKSLEKVFHFYYFLSEKYFSNAACQSALFAFNFEGKLKGGLVNLGISPVSCL